jgi:hypothetical protein
MLTWRAHRLQYRTVLRAQKLEEDESAYLFLDGVSLQVRRPSGRKRVQMLVGLRSAAYPQPVYKSSLDLTRDERSLTTFALSR